MSELVLLGDEAVALGAIHAGISAAYGYPGTPSTEIMEYIQDYSDKNKGPLAEWCTNEKTAYEDAVGTSMMGKRSLVTMKHVGLNVAADPFLNSVLLDIHGGLVLAVADDPGMHSSQSEQDSRFFADYAKTFCFEPRNQQEAYEMVQEAFEVSEKFHVPVLLKLVTRLSHSRAVIKPGKKRAENPLNKSKNKLGWITLPSISRKSYDALLLDQKNFMNYTKNSKFNSLKFNKNFKNYGVITTGLARNYYKENEKDLPEKPSHLHISVYPVDPQMIRDLAENVETIVVIEEGQSFIEKQLRGILPQNIKITGKEDNIIPRSGELNPDNIRPALGLDPKTQIKTKNIDLPNRPPQLCKGCPHKDTFDALTAALAPYPEKLVTSDIGCYTLGFLPPYNAVETALCMGASIGMAKGAAQAGFFPVVATIGDGTFLHTGINGLIDCVASNVNMTIFIMDNLTTGMTGGQDTIYTPSQIVNLVKGAGVDPDHLKIINPLKKYTEENTQIIKKEIEYEGLSVIIPQRECVHTIKKIRRERG